MAQGVLTALQAALAGVSGGITGAQQYREMERKREFEREKEKAAAARQAMLDAAALRGEERQAIASGMIPATQYTGLSQFDMPGATPRQPLLRQTIGGREMVLPEAPKMAEHRAGVAKTIGERKEKAQESTALRSALANVEIGGKKIGDEQAAALAALGANERTVLLGAMRDAARPQRQAGGKEELPDWKKREIGAEFLSSQTFNPALTKALQTRFARDPNAAADPEMVAYEIMQSKSVKPITPMQRYKPPVEKKDKADELAELIKAGEERKSGKAGGAAATAPAAPAPRPAAAPTAPKPPAEPASMADAAAKQASRAELWDKLKAQNPSLSDDEITARVMREIP
jgi:hypothetical protein